MSTEGLLILLAIYITPTIVALLRKEKELTKIIFVNILLGWTVVGWILAMSWACGMDDEKLVETKPDEGGKHKTGTTPADGSEIKTGTAPVGGMKPSGTTKNTKGTKSNKGSTNDGTKKPDKGPAKSEAFLKDGELVKSGEIKKSTGLKGSMTNRMANRKSTWRCLKCETINEDGVCGVCRSERG